MKPDTDSINIPQLKGSKNEGGVHNDKMQTLELDKTRTQKGSIDHRENCQTKDYGRKTKE
uniref:Uncharacterized protein n=1 Tax=Arion vulgaris TaxID=1028688 RepID=A0A0B6Z716_9EUPU